MDAWNRGDIEDFMEGYLNSEELHFVGASSVTYGWGDTLKRYLQAYPDRQTMGTLSFDLKEITERTAEVYTVIGRYNLERDAMEDASGNFLLVIQNVDSHWRIVADSTH